jgi:hypothetical protein
MKQPHKTFPIGFFSLMFIQLSLAALAVSIAFVSIFVFNYPDNYQRIDGLPLNVLSGPKLQKLHWISTIVFLVQIFGMIYFVYPVYTQLEGAVYYLLGISWVLAFNSVSMHLAVSQS